MFCLKSTVVLGFFSYPLLLRYPQKKKYSDYGHSFRWILKCQRNINWVTTTGSLFLKIVSTAKTRCSTDQRSMATEMLWVSLEGRSRTNSPRQRFHSQLLPNRQVFLPDPVLLPRSFIHIACLRSNYMFRPFFLGHHQVDQPHDGLEKWPKPVVVSKVRYVNKAP